MSAAVARIVWLPPGEAIGVELARAGSFPPDIATAAAPAKMDNERMGHVLPDASAQLFFLSQLPAMIPS
jgi:hypothetical protein